MPNGENSLRVSVPLRAVDHKTFVDLRVVIGSLSEELGVMADEVAMLKAQVANLSRLVKELLDSP